MEVVIALGELLGFLLVLYIPYRLLLSKEQRDKIKKHIQYGGFQDGTKNSSA